MNRGNVKSDRIPRTWRGVLLLVTAFGLIGCGAISPVKPIRDVNSLVGRWDGGLNYQRAQYGTTHVGATWTIREDGTFEIITPRWRASGTLRVEDGQIYYYATEASGFYSDGLRASGIATLHEDAGGRYLLTSGHPDSFGYWWPAK